MAFRLATFAGTGTDTDPFRVPGATAIIDLRPDEKVASGYALAVGPVDPAYIVESLGEDRLAKLPASVRNKLSNALSYTVQDYGLGRLFSDVLLAGKGAGGKILQPMRDGKYRTHLGGLFDEFLVISGGAVLTDSFDQADSTTVGPGMTWEEIGDGRGLDFKTRTNRLVADEQDVTNHARAWLRAATDLTTDNHYAEMAILESNGSNMQIGVACRMNPAATATRTTGDTNYNWHLNNSSGIKPRKYIDGAITNLGTEAAYTLVSGDVFRLELDGSTLTAKINGTAHFTVTDTSITGNKRVGVVAFVANDSVANQVTDTFVVDSFGGGDLGGVTATINHGFLLGDSGTAEAKVTASGSHGLVLNDSGTAISNTATINHGFLLGDSGTAEAKVTATGEHGLTLDDSGTAERGPWPDALMLGDSGTTEAKVTATAKHGLTLGDSGTADNTATSDWTAYTEAQQLGGDSLILGDSGTAEAKVSATVDHGLVLGDEGTATGGTTSDWSAYIEAGLSATISHGLVLDNSGTTSTTMPSSYRLPRVTTKQSLAATFTDFDRTARA